MEGPAGVSGKPCTHLGCLWVAELLTTAWIAFRFGTRASMALRELLMAVSFHVSRRKRQTY